MTKTKKPIVLTEDTYYTEQNTYLSHSKIKDFLKEPWYFYEKHVLKQTEQTDSDTLLLGRMVDVYITEGKKQFEQSFVPVARRSKDRVSEDGREEVTFGLYEEALGLARSIVSQDAFKEMEGFETQKILQVEKPVGNLFTGLCGKPDWINVDEKSGKCTIRDLKTTKSINTREFYYSAINYGYFSQACYYALLATELYGVTNFTFEILAVEKDKELGYRVQTFTLNKERVIGEKGKLKQAIKDIAETKKWKPRNVSFNDTIELV